MTRIYLPDTNAVSVFNRAASRSLHEKFIAHADGLRLSSLVWFELRYGAEKRPDLARLIARLDRLRVVIPELEPFDEEAAWHAGRLRAYLETLKPNAQPIGPYDVLIAGQALSLGAVLVTRNLDEFRRVPGLLIENWETD
jgi:tRNA(fMet)-specific endonuclease VapC